MNRASSSNLRWGRRTEPKQRKKSFDLESRKTEVIQYLNAFIIQGYGLQENDRIGWLRDLFIAYGRLTKSKLYVRPQTYLDSYARFCLMALSAINDKLVCKMGEIRHE